MLKSLKVLDCTLRDGGYCNEWHFGNGNIKKIVKGLMDAGIDIVECGFLGNKKVHTADVTQFNHIGEFTEFLPENRNDRTMFVCMINYGEYNADDIEEYDGNSVDAVRVAFHKNNRLSALEFCRDIQAKGYKIFVQAMVSRNYSDEEFLDLLNRVNEIKPYAFYIVDSFGTMKRNELIRLFYMVEHNLADGIAIGWHSHNNMQLSYANAQTLVDIHTKRELIIDSSIHGMGRGAGNLNTELFVDYLNDNFDKNYVLKPILNIIDEIIGNFYERTHWGYSLPNYISARHNAHPNYARYFSDKQTLTFESMDEIFEMMEESKRVSFNAKYAEEIYLKYMSRGETFLEHKEDLRQILQRKKVLLIAPGKSAGDYREKISELIESPNVCSISINHDYPFAETNFIFTSNLRRYRLIDETKQEKCIVTSNIPSAKAYLRVDYHNLLDGESTVTDNAGIMAIHFLLSFDVKEVCLAGFDGYSHDTEENYIDEDMAFIVRRAVAEVRNKGMIKALDKLSKSINIRFITPTRYSSGKSGGGENSSQFGL